MESALFTYRRAQTLIHRSPAILKLIVLFVLSLTIFSSAETSTLQWIILGAHGLFASLCFILAKIPLNHLKKIAFVPLMGLFVTAFRVFSFFPFSVDVYQIPAGLLYTARFLVATLFALIFFETTSTMQITDSLEKIQSVIARCFPPLKPLFRKINPALIIGIAIGFIPRVFSTWQKVRLSAISRSEPKSKLSFYSRILRIEVQFSALLSCMINSAETTRKAVLNRTELE